MKNFFESIKAFWIKNLRPIVRPALTEVIKHKVEKEVGRHK